ncbi:MAG TPA: histidine kinase dimerization/phosphoacceptor domain -containing protein [Caulobacter sp.]|nr:histidine kinase dimerization/phosphoacceptor domain -containing protein [Caulobacter sp.]
MSNALQDIAEAQTLAQAIVDTIHEPLLVLDARLRVMAASRAFCETFMVDRDETQGALLYDLGEGQWDIPGLRLLLETIIPEHTAMDGFEVSHDFPRLGLRTMLLNARKVVYETSPDMTILLAFTDVTARRAIERDKDRLLQQTEELLRQKQILLQEMEHRVANSLQIIASILMLKARAVTSDETRGHLKDAHQRVMSVAAVQSHLHASEGLDQIEVGPYLTKLCASLGASMIGDDRPMNLTVAADAGRLGSAQAVSIGLIVTELVINAVKYAFPAARPDAAVRVGFESGGEAWRLTVSDNGVGKPAADADGTGGLGTVIVQALVKQLGARMETASDGAGMSVAVARG